MPVSPLCGGIPEDGAAHLGFFVIPQGEQWSMTASDGLVSVHDGPCTLRCLGAVLAKRRAVIANESEYLEMRFMDGHSEIVPGPACLFEDPLQHKQIVVKPATSLKNNEALVIYSETSVGKGGGDKQVRREVVRGPLLYKPKLASEWTHHFSWHGHDPSGDQLQLARKRPHALKFEKLQLAPSSTYFDVENVRSADDALLTVRLMIFFQLDSVERMMDATNDPIADIVNSVSSDVISFCAARSFEQFKENSESLNQLGLYQNLTSTVASRGLTVSKVVFRGYVAPSRLQKMHDDAIEKRTKLGLERESEVQEQRLIDERLAKDEEREKTKRQMEMAKAEHRARLQRTDFEASQREMREAAEQETEAQRAKHDAERAHYEALRAGLQLAPADVAALLVAKAHVPAKLIQITGGGAEARPIVHVDQ